MIFHLVKYLGDLSHPIQGKVCILILRRDNFNILKVGGITSIGKFTWNGKFISIIDDVGRVLNVFESLFLVLPLGGIISGLRNIGVFLGLPVAMILEFICSGCLFRMFLRLNNDRRLHSTSMFNEVLVPFSIQVYL